jgi:hypothetical protein
VFGRGGRPAGGDERDQAPGDLGGVRVGLVDLDRHGQVAADRWRGGPGHARVGSLRVGGNGDAVHAASTGSTALWGLVLADHGMRLQVPLLMGPVVDPLVPTKDPQEPTTVTQQRSSTTVVSRSWTGPARPA